jgi:hypothetical protein
MPATAHFIRRSDGLFERRWGKPGFAYDSVDGLHGTTLEKLLAFLKGKLSAEDFVQLRSLLGEVDAMAADDPAPFRGMPKTGGTMTALDRLPPSLRRKTVDAIMAARESQRESFDERFPNAARIKIV